MDNAQQLPGQMSLTDDLTNPQAPSIFKSARRSPGRQPAPIGAIRTTHRGELQIKVADRIWVSLARYNLTVHLDRNLRSTEQVRFKDGDKTNCKVENLEIWEMVRTWPN